MANEKKKATDAIIKQLQDQKDDIIDQDYDAIVGSLQDILNDYKGDIEKLYQDKLNQQKLQYEQELKQLESSLRYTCMIGLLDYRSTLLNEFKIEIESDLVNFRQSSKYQDYLTELVLSVRDASVIYCDKSDVKRIDFKEVIGVDMPLGGIRIETDDRVYDYTFATRLEEALVSFQSNPKLQIKGGHYE